MVSLSDGARADVRANICKGQEKHFPGGVDKTDGRAAVNNIDDWWDKTGWTSMNSQLPQPYKGAANKKQKIRMLIRVLRKRIEESI